MKYDIFAVGNALVDLEFEVTDQELQILNIAKGYMTLIDAHRHSQLLDDLDGFKHAKASGGSAANSIITAQLLGAKTFYCCRVADDENGNFFYNDLQWRGVISNLDQNDRSAGVTGKCIVLLTPDGERSMNTYLGISETLSPKDITEKAIQESHFVYIEGYLVAIPSTFNTALRVNEIAQQYGIKRATTLADPNMVLYFKDNLKKIMARPVDLLFCNEEEAYLFCETENLEQVKKILPQYAKTFAITLGAKGSLAFDGTEFYHCPAAPITLLDTVGAGDVFAGAFMFALSRRHSYKEANYLANIAAGRIVSKFGPRIDSQDAAFILHQYGLHKENNNVDNA